MVAQDEGVKPAQVGATEGTDWDAGWDSDDKEEPQAETPAKIIQATTKKEPKASNTHKPQANSLPEDGDEDDTADAWGWGDEDVTDEIIPDPKIDEDKQSFKHLETGPEMREVTLSEPYWISSIPKSVFDIIEAIYDDGAELIKTECVYT